MAVIDWWNGLLTLVIIFFALCLLQLTWSIASIACRACHSSGIFSMWYSHARSHACTLACAVLIKILCFVSRTLGTHSDLSRLWGFDWPGLEKVTLCYTERKRYDQDREETWCAGESEGERESRRRGMGRERRKGDRRKPEGVSGKQVENGSWLGFSKGMRERERWEG